MEKESIKINSRFIGQSELIIENLIGFIKPQTSEDTILKLLLILENIKAFYSIKEYFKEDEKFLSTEETEKEEFEIKVESLNLEKINNLWENPKEIFKELKQSLTNIKKTQIIIWEESENLQTTTEILNNTHKPLKSPDFLKIFPGKKKKFKILLMVSEMVFILRPLIHCYLLKIFKSNSYKPYLFNIFSDILWIILLLISEKPVVLKNKEIKNRFKTIFFNYLLRNPFYDRVVKQKLLLKILELFFKNGFFKNILIRLIDFRSSFSYVM